MKNCLMRSMLALMLGLMACASHAWAQQGENASLTNAAVVKLARAGFKEKTIIAIIRTRPAHFDLSPDRLIDLKRNGVSENVILVMLAREEVAGSAFENLSDDPFFDDSSKGSHSQKSSGGGGDNSTDIFGSTNGSSGRTRSRGADGANEGDTMTTGSATVRILRPPVEPGAAPKLEKTPTLNNQSIMELADAGFTEGTIIRRIEQSPADFELTPEKIAELHRRHVSDKIIAAMKSAMSETATP